MKTAFVLVAGLATFGAKAGLDCARIAVLAEVTMAARQSGMSVADADKVARGIAAEKDSGMTTRIATTLVKQAYSRPQYDTIALKKQEAVEYANGWYLACTNELDE